MSNFLLVFLNHSVPISCEITFTFIEQIEWCYVFLLKLKQVKLQRKTVLAVSILSIQSDWENIDSWGSSCRIPTNNYNNNNNRRPE